MSEYRDSHDIYEEYGYVLDYLPQGKPGTRLNIHSENFIQLIGENYFTLLEATIRKNIVLKPMDRVFIGKIGRIEITHVIGRIGYNELTLNSKMELENTIEKIVINREKWFVNFFNTSQPITQRMHSLELIPGIGKKYMWRIIDYREQKPFQSFSQIQEKTGLSDLLKIIIKRILEELSGESKHKLFAR